MRGSIATLILVAGAAQAEVPNVVTDIPPVHSLAAQVMGDLGTPKLLIDPESDDPHHMQLRPSQARQLANADLVVWMGKSMTPWLVRVMENLADNFVSLELLELDDMPLLLGVAELEPLADPNDAEHHEDDGHGHDEHGDDTEHHEDEGHGHDGHATDTEHHEDEGHGHDGHATDTEHHEDEGHGHDGHATDTEHHEDEGHGHDHHGHDHGLIDPHAWLDPVNAQRFVASIADALSQADPENAAIYQANASEAKARLAVLTADITAQLIPHEQATLVTYHDAYRYFFIRFGLNQVGSLLDFEASLPSAARLVRTRDVLARDPDICFFVEPGGLQKLINTVHSDAERLTSELDPIGRYLTPGPDLYEGLIRNMADTIAGCSTQG